MPTQIPQSCLDGCLGNGSRACGADCTFNCTGDWSLAYGGAPPYNPSDDDLSLEEMLQVVLVRRRRMRQ